MSILQARRRAERLATECGVKSAPVDIEAVARHVGLRVVRTTLGGDISGLLVTREGVSMICVEERHHENRRRFTIAHEIGHHVLGHHFGSGRTRSRRSRDHEEREVFGGDGPARDRGQPVCGCASHAGKSGRARSSTAWELSRGRRRARPRLPLQGEFGGDGDPPLRVGLRYDADLTELWCWQGVPPDQRAAHQQVAGGVHDPASRFTAGGVGLVRGLHPHL